MNANTTAASVPNRPELVITIAGRACTGKSTLAMLIAMCLEKVGIEVAEIKNEDTDPAMLAETFQTRLKSLAARNPQVTIDMTQLARDVPKLIIPGGR